MKYDYLIFSIDVVYLLGRRLDRRVDRANLFYNVMFFIVFLSRKFLVENHYIFIPTNVVLKNVFERLFVN